MTVLLINFVESHFLVAWHLDSVSGHLSRLEHTCPNTALRAVHYIAAIKHKLERKFLMFLELSTYYSICCSNSNNRLDRQTCGRPALPKPWFHILWKGFSSVETLHCGRHFNIKLCLFMQGLSEQATDQKTAAVESGSIRFAYDPQGVDRENFSATDIVVDTLCRQAMTV